MLSPPFSSCLLGAIVGDMAGSRYEHVARSKKESADDWTFPLLTDRCWYTDDTVLTIAIADAILQQYDTPTTTRRGMFNKKKLTLGARQEVYADCLRKWAKRYPKAGYGAKFSQWVVDDTAGPYNSWGNGAAMRVSAIGYLPQCTSIEDVLDEARRSAACTHNHPEGIKGAQAIAVCIYLARTGQSKPDIQAYIETNFDGYNLHRSISVKRINFNQAAKSRYVPESIIAFLEGTNYEDVVRHAINLGGDADTQAAMAGSIAHAFYNSDISNNTNHNRKKQNHTTDNDLVGCAKRMLPDDMLAIIDRFDKFVIHQHQHQQQHKNDVVTVVDTCC